MFDIDINVNDNSPINESENMAAFIFLPEVDVKDYQNNPSAFRKMLKDKMEATLNG